MAWAWPTWPRAIASCRVDCGEEKGFVQSVGLELAAWQYDTVADARARVQGRGLSRACIARWAPPLSADVAENRLDIRDGWSR